eukprot:scaffold48459_cov26-Cyclotella_meneghiniana.AAC.1
MHCVKARRHALGACIRRVLTSPDSCCEGAQAYSSPAPPGTFTSKTMASSTMADIIGRISATTGN